MPRAISYYILVIGKEGKWQSNLQGFTKAFIEDFTPNQTWVISLTEIEGYDKPLIEYTTWDEEKDGPIPGIKLFKHLNIFLEREYCEY